MRVCSLYLRKAPQRNAPTQPVLTCIVAPHPWMQRQEATWQHASAITPGTHTPSQRPRCTETSPAECTNTTPTQAAATKITQQCRWYHHHRYHHHLYRHHCCTATAVPPPQAPAALVDAQLQPSQYSAGYEAQPMPVHPMGHRRHRLPESCSIIPAAASVHPTSCFVTETQMSPPTQYNEVDQGGCMVKFSQ